MTIIGGRERRLSTASLGWIPFTELLNSTLFLDIGQKRKDEEGKDKKEKTRMKLFLCPIFWFITLTKDEINTYTTIKFFIPSLMLLNCNTFSSLGT